MRNDITHGRKGSPSARSASELRRSVRVPLQWALVLAVLVGLLGMHGLAGHAADSHGAAHAAGHSAGTHAASLIPPAGHAAHGQAGEGPMLAHEARPHSSADPAACQPGGDEDVPAAAHCTPAPGATPPMAPTALVLSRSDALPRAPGSQAQPVSPLVPALDLSELSISRT